MSPDSTNSQSGFDIKLALLALGIFLLPGLLSCKETGIGKKVELGDFAEYASRFTSLAPAYGSEVKIEDLIIRWGDLANEFENGICEVNGRATPVVTIDVYAWEEMDEFERESLVFHELGHCVLRRYHRNGWTQGGIPASIMNPYSFDGWIYSNYEHYYLEELYSKRNEF